MSIDATIAAFYEQAKEQCAATRELSAAVSRLADGLTLLLQQRPNPRDGYPLPPYADEPPPAEERKLAPVETVVEEAKAEPVVEEAKVQAPAAKKPTTEDVRKALRDYAALEGKEAAKELLRKHGADTVGGLREENYAALIADAG